MGIAIYILAFAFLLIGVYALVAKKNIVRIIIGIAILEYAVNLLLVLVGYRKDGLPPILAKGQTSADLAARAVDPLPQAMVLTSIVIGLSITALAVAMAVRLYDKYGTFDMNDIRNLRG
jgi:multicomponent Na+:H+ antiporter subunit C